MGYDRQKVINIALAEVGYLEKNNKNNLDDKTAGAGNKNYTKYARDLDAIGFYNGRKQSVAWCDVFVDWCFVQAYGEADALKLTCQPTKAESNYGAGCKYSRNYYKNKGQLHDTPEVGDQIFFYSSDKSSIAHTGLVYKVDSTYVYTVEGNTSGDSGVVANGGGVFKKKYKLNYSRFAGFGRPAYGDGYNSSVDGSVEKDEETTAEENKTAQNVNTVGKSVSITLNTLRKGNEGNQVKTLQRLLNALGYACGEVDGIFGHRTDGAVNVYQADKGLEVDGVVGRNTWSALLK